MKIRRLDKLDCSLIIHQQLDLTFLTVQGYYQLS